MTPVIAGENLTTSEIRPLVLGSRDDVAVLPVMAGAQYKVVGVAADNVGNRRPLTTDSLSNFIVIDYPIVAALCPNNCSDHGNCSSIGTCTCEEGFYGRDCSAGMTDIN